MPALTRSHPTMTQARPRPAKHRGEGQWALGYREPLNPNEQNKKDDAPLNVRARIENIYALRGFDSIDKNDLRGRFRWWGLYTQREQGYDGTWTGDEHIETIEAKYFMMRVRCDGGALTVEQLRTLGQLSTEFARDTADISDRENLQMHWIQVEDVPEIWRRLEAVGLQTTEACGDCPRVVLGSPLAGESLDEVLDASSAVDEIVRRYIGKPEYANLPRKYKTAISGLQDVVHEVNDIAFIGVNHPEHGPGLDVWVGGGLSTNPMLGQRLGAWGPLDDVVSALEALGLPSRPSQWRRNLMACTGIEYCKLSFAETRVRAQGLVPDLEKRLEDINAQLEVPITVNINGCPNSCARIQVADIGFKGQMVDDGDGPVEGFQVHLG